MLKRYHDYDIYSLGKTKTMNNVLGLLGLNFKHNKKSNNSVQTLIIFYLIHCDI